MENNKIILILLIVIVILAVCLGAVMMPSFSVKDDCKLTVSSGEKYVGDALTVKLTDLNKTPIANETVSVEILDDDGKSVFKKDVTTNSKGKSKMDMDLDEGIYVVNVTFSGNDKFNANSTSKNLKIKERVTESASSFDSTGNAYVDSILNNPDCKVVRDPYAICPTHGVPYWQDNYCDWFVDGSL